MWVFDNIADSDALEGEGSGKTAQIFPFSWHSTFLPHLSDVIILDDVDLRLRELLMCCNKLATPSNVSIYLSCLWTTAFKTSQLAGVFGKGSQRNFDLVFWDRGATLKIFHLRWHIVGVKINFATIPFVRRRWQVGLWGPQWMLNRQPCPLVTLGREAQFNQLKNCWAILTRGTCMLLMYQISKAKQWWILLSIDDASHCSTSGTFTKTKVSTWMNAKRCELIS